MNEGDRQEFLKEFQRASIKIYENIENKSDYQGMVSGLWCASKLLDKYIREGKIEVKKK